MTCLELVARSRGVGVLQSEVSRVMGIVSRNFFYLVKVLIGSGGEEAHCVWLRACAAARVVCTRCFDFSSCWEEQTLQSALAQPTGQPLGLCKDMRFTVPGSPSSCKNGWALLGNKQLTGGSGQGSNRTLVQLKLCFLLKTTMSFAPPSLQCLEERCLVVKTAVQIPVRDARAGKC